MSANENPAISDGESDNTHGPGSRYVDYIAPKLSPAAAKWLEAWCDAIADGSVSLAQLPLPVVSLYLLGYAHAEIRQTGSNDDRIARLEYERDLWYYCHANNATPADFMRAHTNLLWSEGVAA